MDCKHTSGFLSPSVTLPFSLSFRMVHKEGLCYKWQKYCCSNGDGASQLLVVPSFCVREREKNGDRRRVRSPLKVLEWTAVVNGFHGCNHVILFCGMHRHCRLIFAGLFFPFLKIPSHEWVDSTLRNIHYSAQKLLLCEQLWRNCGDAFFTHYWAIAVGGVNFAYHFSRFKEN